MYYFLSWVCSGLKVLAPEESWVPSARNTPFLVCKKQQVLPVRALQVGSVFACPGSCWGKCVTLEESRFHVPVAVLRGVQHLKCWRSSYQAPVLLFSLSWPHLFLFPNPEASSSSGRAFLLIAQFTVQMFLAYAAYMASIQGTENNTWYFRRAQANLIPSWFPLLCSCYTSKCLRDPVSCTQSTAWKNCHKLPQSNNLSLIIASKLCSRTQHAKWLDYK